MSEPSVDPRVFLAAERTLLAWIRTGLAVIGLGFVVARFGLFMSTLRREPNPMADAGSTWIGVGLVLLGSAAIAMAARQHLRYCRATGPAARPRPNLTAWSVAFAVLLTAIGAILAAYLLLRSGLA